MTALAPVLVSLCPSGGDVVSSDGATSARVLVALAGQGPAGPPGPGTVVIDYEQAATVWTLNHNLNTYPTITLFDTAGDQLALPTKTVYVDKNTVTLTFGRPLAGTAYLH